MTPLANGRVGECDECHAEPVVLFDYASEPEAGWEFCLPCLRKVEAADRAAAKRIRENALHFMRSCMPRTRGGVAS